MLSKNTPAAISNAAPKWANQPLSIPDETPRIATTSPTLVNDTTKPAESAKPVENIAAVRLSAMGDVIHALPAVAALKRGYPRARLSWLIHRKWAWLLEGNPYVDVVIEFDRHQPSVAHGAWLPAS